MLLVTSSSLKVLDGRVALAVAVFLYGLFRGALVGFELFDFGRVHVFHHCVCLPLFEGEADAL